MEVRRIRPDEHAAAGDVCVAAYDPLLTGAEDDYRDRLHDVATRAAQAEVWVAVVEGGVVGVVTYCPPGSPWREIGRDDEGEFRMLAVDPAAQGAGAGTALARLCEERAREHGASAVMVAPPNGARNLEAVAGYYAAVAEAARLPLVIQDEPVTTQVVMPATFLARLAADIPSAEALKLEEPPTLPKITRLRQLVPRPLAVGVGPSKRYAPSTR